MTPKSLARRVLFLQCLILAGVQGKVQATLTLTFQRLKQIQYPGMSLLLEVLSVAITIWTTVHAIQQHPLKNMLKMLLKLRTLVRKLRTRSRLTVDQFSLRRILIPPRKKYLIQVS